MRETGLEPTHPLRVPAPQAGASAYSATLAGYDQANISTLLLNGQCHDENGSAIIASAPAESAWA